MKSPTAQLYEDLLKEYKQKRRNRLMLAGVIGLVLGVSATAYIQPISVAPELLTCNVNVPVDLQGWTPAYDAGMQFTSGRSEMQRRPTLVCCPNEVCLEHTPGRKVLNQWWYKGETKINQIKLPALNKEQSQEKNEDYKKRGLRVDPLGKFTTPGRCIGWTCF
jgi:hypothetical protein